MSSSPGTPGCASPATNRVGVVTTPARTPGAEVALHPLLHRRPSGGRASKRSRSRPSRSRALPEVRLVEVALVVEQRVVHLPEAALQRPAASAAPASTRARGCLETTGKCRNTRRTGSSPRIRCARAQYGTLVVAVLDHRRGAARPRTWSSAPAAAGAGRGPAAAVLRSSASKIRFAPGISSGRGRRVATSATVAVRARSSRARARCDRARRCRRRTASRPRPSGGSPPAAGT